MIAEIALNDGVYPLTPEAIPGLTAQIVKNLATLGFPGTARQSLEDFLKVLHGEPSVSAVALVSATAIPRGPSLDVYVLMKGTARLLEEDIERMERVGGYHDRFFSALGEAAHDTNEGYYSTGIHIKTPVIDSIEKFQGMLVHQFGVGTSAGLLLVAQLIRSHIE